MVLLIDNYDSFTYNLYQVLRQLTPHVAVFRNDAISVEEIVRLGPARIVISPGPGVPERAGISKEVIRRLGRDSRQAREHARVGGEGRRAAMARGDRRIVVQRRGIPGRTAALDSPGTRRQSNTPPRHNPTRQFSL